MDKYDLSRFGLSYAGADPQQIARMNAEIDHNPIDIQPRPTGHAERWYDPKRPMGKFGPLAMRPEMYRPGMVVDPHPLPDLLARLKGE